MKNILLIEDDKALRENTEQLLELAGYSVKTAPNGKTPPTRQEIIGERYMG